MATVYKVEVGLVSDWVSYNEIQMQQKVVKAIKNLIKEEEEKGNEVEISHVNVHKK